MLTLSFFLGYAFVNKNNKKGFDVIAVFFLLLPLLAIATAKIAEWEILFVNEAFTDIPMQYSNSRPVYHWALAVIALVSLVTSFSNNFGFLIFLIVFLVSGATGARTARNNMREQGHPIRHFGGPFD